MTTYLDSWDDSTSNMKGYIAVDSNSNADTSFGIFQAGRV
jgi:hypothetical protein